MEIKKSNIGGLDKIDVYIHIQELIKMYGNYAEQELDKQKETLDKQQKEIEELITREKAAREELDSRRDADNTKEQEIEKQREQIISLIPYKEIAAGLKGENEILNQKIEAQKQEIVELKKSNTLLPELQDRTATLDNKVRELKQELDNYRAVGQELEKETQIQKTEISELKQYKDQAIKLQYEVQRQKAEAEELEIYKEVTSKLQEETQEQKRQIKELQKYEDLAIRQQVEADMLRKEVEGLQQPGVFSEKAQAELVSCKKEILELKEEIQARTAETQELKGKIQRFQSLHAKKEEFYTAMIQELENTKEEKNGRKDLVSASEDMQRKLSEREQIVMEKEQEIQSIIQKLREKEKELESQKEENTVQSKESFNYMQEIGEILREARREGQHIIDNARVEAEQEMIRLLNLRAKYKWENEVYRNWCKRVETEKRLVEEFLKQLSAQYEDANRVFDSVKEDTNSFDLKKIFKAIDSQQTNAEEADYEEKDLV